MPGVLLFDEPGSDCTQLDVHKGTTDAGADRAPPDIRICSAAVV